MADSRKAKERNRAAMIMIKTKENSKFMLLSGVELGEHEILQIETEKQYENGAGYGVYLCEVDTEGRNDTE